ncbi:type VI secretion system tube protein TssD [Hymenobacter negativus]|uniref:Novel toxin 16 domain-containing protein n=1 Tax=Hymenobacter negativus TaxID=2795026 RepID=A0ABS3QLD2_9BACT|nr:type VI secretion system tube protein TssD [Hymenobacter negativus]MBO2012056.1 hypothetical protein [Hymenobacter negativus]
MGSFSAELRIGSRVYPVVRFHTAFMQATEQRGRPSAKLRHGQLEIELDVPHDDQLFAWAADPRKTFKGSLTTLDAMGRAQEHISFATAHCVQYSEVFQVGDVATGAYRCRLHISDPSGFTIGVGAAATPFVPPAARDHGQPLAAAPQAAPPDASDCTPAVTSMLQKQVDLMCKPQGVSSRCTDADSCPLLLQKIAMTEACIEARRTINNQCFRGGNAGHQRAIEERQNGIRKCQAIYLRQCGSQQQPVPVPRRVPSSDPVTPPPNDVLVPTTVAGVGLLILYILSSALRPGPI